MMMQTVLKKQRTRVPGGHLIPWAIFAAVVYGERIMTRCNQNCKRFFDEILASSIGSVYAEEAVL